MLLYVHQARPHRRSTKPQGDVGRWCRWRGQAAHSRVAAVPPSRAPRRKASGAVSSPGSRDADGLSGLSASCCVPHGGHHALPIRVVPRAYRGRSPQLRSRPGEVVRWKAIVAGAVDHEDGGAGEAALERRAELLGLVDADPVGACGADVRAGQRRLARGRRWPPASRRSSRIAGRSGLPRPG
jgi:hypothetical protein